MGIKHLLIIDPQNDFCDLPPRYCPDDPLAPPAKLAPALPVAGAHADMLRIAALIDAGREAWAEISLTLDSHHLVDIGHPGFWQTGAGGEVAPFTAIGAEDLRAGRFRPRAESALPRVLAYLDALEAGGRRRHTVWPVHCEIGTWGQAIHPAVRAACNRWELRHQRQTAKVCKGANPWTEHYSAIQAEVPDPADPGTAANAWLVERLRLADRVYVCGEAASHCVRATVEHLAQAFGPAGAGKLVLLADCMSPVAGFEAEWRDFLAAAGGLGLGVADSVGILPELLA